MMVLNNEELLNELLNVSLRRKQLEVNAMLGNRGDVAFFNDNKSSLDKTIELLKKDVLEKMK